MRGSRLLSLVSLVMLAPPAALAGQAAGAESGPVGLLVVAHGADSGWNARVHRVVGQVEWPGPVALAFLMGGEAATASWDAALEHLEAAAVSRIVVVPLMVSSHGAHVRQIRHYAGEPVALPAALAGHDHGAMRRPSVPVVVTGAIDAAPELGEMLAARWRELPAAIKERPVMLVAHGPTSDADAVRWVRAIDRAIDPLAAAVGGDRVRIGLLRDDAPEAVRGAAVAAIRDTIAALAGRHGDSVVVMTVLVSSGSIDRVRIPADLRDTPMHYVGGVLAPHPALAAWIRRVASEAGFRKPRSAAPSRPARR